MAHSITIVAAFVLTAGTFANAAPDMVTGDIGPAAITHGTVGGITAYSFADTLCNLGAGALTVNFANDQHPIVTPNLYRYRVVNGAGRFEQLGQGWCFHQFCALQVNVCATCSPEPVSCAALGSGCSTSTTASSMGGQSQLGPRWEVNPGTGAFTMPFSTPGAGALAGRLQVPQSALDPALNAGAQYFVEHLQVGQGDAGIADANNASYRRVVVGAMGPNGYALTGSGTTVREATPIDAWQTIDPGVTEFSTAAAGGTIVVGSAATDLGGGWWHYEYAVYNMNADRAVGAFAVPMGATIALSQIGSTDVDYHGPGNPYSSEFWLGVRAGGQLTWACTPHATNPNANAIRWGTMYSFRFDANAAPSSQTGTLTLFKPGTPTNISIPGLKVPQIPPPPCPGDTNADNAVNSADLSVLLGQFGAAVPPGSGADFNGDGLVNAADLSVLLANFGGAC